MRSTPRAILGAAGVAATLLGVLAITHTGVVTETEPLASVATALSDIGVQSLVVTGSFVVGMYLLRAAARSVGDRTVAGDRAPAEEFEQILDTPPERVTADDEAGTAGEFEDRIERAMRGDEQALDGVRERFATVTVACLTRYDEYTRESAERAVAAGTWTDDPVAGAFLAGDEGPVLSFGSRLRIWLDPETERQRRVRRTVAAIERLDGHDYAGLSTAFDGTTGRSRSGDATTAWQDSQSAGGRESRPARGGEG